MESFSINNDVSNADDYRKEAIKYALESLAQDEILVILGKGDETYQEIKGVKYPFSDKQVVRELLDGCV